MVDVNLGSRLSAALRRRGRSPICKLWRRIPMPDAPTNPETPRRPPAAPLFAATLAFCGGILLQSYCYKPATLYFLCTLALALSSLLALRFAKGGRRALLAYSGAVLAFLPAGALFTAAHQVATRRRCQPC